MLSNLSKITKSLLLLQVISIVLNSSTVCMGKIPYTYPGNDKENFIYNQPKDDQSKKKDLSINECEEKNDTLFKKMQDYTQELIDYCEKLTKKDAAGKNIAKAEVTGDTHARSENYIVKIKEVMGRFEEYIKKVEKRVNLLKNGNYNLFVMQELINLANKLMKEDNKDELQKIIRFIRKLIENNHKDPSEKIINKAFQLTKLEDNNLFIELSNLAKNDQIQFQTKLESFAKKVNHQRVSLIRSYMTKAMPTEILQNIKHIQDMHYNDSKNNGGYE